MLSLAQTLGQQHPIEDGAVVVMIRLAAADEGKLSALPDVVIGELVHHQEGEDEVALQHSPNLHHYQVFCIKKDPCFVPSCLFRLF